MNSNATLEQTPGHSVYLVHITLKLFFFPFWSPGARNFFLLWTEHIYLTSNEMASFHEFWFDTDWSVLTPSLRQSQGLFSRLRLQALMPSFRLFCPCPNQMILLLLCLSVSSPLVAPIVFLFSPINSAP